MRFYPASAGFFFRLFFIECFRVVGPGIGPGVELHTIYPVFIVLQGFQGDLWDLLPSWSKNGRLESHINCKNRELPYTRHELVIGLFTNENT